ncbi:HET-domain-containing protein [Lophium mytilinum]|uniref:HET-domain-containing protein n=1 Tax=Lophium mytilinum TaxID=390894 RepID=A0A6A6QP27_9PEZI|nr:HET-domain-containing protein [Lophium mytilinum]
MRLLRCKDEGEFSLVEYFGRNIPQYAILSHIWGADDEEITFRDLIESTGKSKAGYRKLTFCAKQAAHDGLQLFWVDTCCIDKSSSSELSEAINSMFRWYHEATRCYVYLSDLSTGGLVRDDEFSREPTFTRSKWFTRGWTLQELLAPRSVEFFSQEGMYLGDKASLEQQIHEITGIDIPALRGTPLCDFNIEKRLSWARKRQTTREEDKAYSLLGIFDIFMPLLYGEGEENALKRLRKKIEKPKEKRKILEWLSSLSPKAKQIAITSLRQPGTSDWFLHEQAVVDWVNDGNLIWLHGPSGAGKTVLVSAIIDNLQASCSVGPVPKAIAYHYCDFANPPTLDVTSVIGSLVRQLVEQMDRVPSAVRDRYHQRCTDFPEVETFIGLLEETATQSFEVTYLIIDGIDECPNRCTLLRNIEKLRRLAWNKGQCRILLSSRPEYDIRQALLVEPHFAMLPRHVEPSMEIHVRNELTKIPRLRRLPAPAREHLVKDLVSGADGMYRWIQCQLDVLQEIRTQRALETALETLPEGLNETYDRILENIKEGDYEHILRLFKWLVGSERPLRLEELAESIAIDPAKDRFDAKERLLETEEVLALCGSLLRVDADGTVVLAHFSVKEYLLCNRLTTQKHKIARFALQEASSKQHVMGCLLTYVSTIGLELQSLLNKRLNEGDYPLFSYARSVPIDRFRDFDMRRPWVESHFPTDETKYRQLVSIIDYTKPPAQYAANYTSAWFVQQVIQCSLMCYWNGCTMQQDYDLYSTVNIGTISDDIADLFLRFQLEW